MGPPPKRQRMSSPADTRDQLDRRASLRDEHLRFAKDDILSEPKLEIRDGRLVHGRRRAHSVGDGRPLLQRRQNASADLTAGTSSVVTIDVSAGTDTTTSIPTVPSVPAFPSDLTVPAVPQTGTATPADATANSSQQVLSASPPSTPLPASSSATVTAAPGTAPTGTAGSSGNTTLLSSSLSSALRTTLSSSRLSATGSLASLLSSNSTTLTSSSSTTTPSSSSSSTSSSSTSSSTEPSSTGSSSSSTATWNAVPTAAGGGDSSQTGSGTGSGGGNGSGNGNDDTTPPGVIAGAVTGSVGAAAVLLILAWILLRWYRRRAMRRLARLPADNSLTSLAPPSGPSGGMSQGHTFLPAGLMSKMSRASRGTTNTSPSAPEGERGFQKIAGRKMQSQFDDKYEGPMTRNFEAERQRQQQHESVLSDASFYSDSHGSVAGEGPSTYDPTAKETLMPSPARTAVVHSGVYSQDFAQPPGTSRSTLSPPQTPLAAQTFSDGVGRSHRDGSRNSRFTEEV